MVVGVGVDIVLVERLEDALRRRPRLRERIFHPDEIGRGDIRSLAARFAAKEAARKALGRRLSGIRWQDAHVAGGRGEPPRLLLEGAMLAAARALGIQNVHLSLSHEKGLAIAMVVMES